MSFADQLIAKGWRVHPETVIFDFGTSDMAISAAYEKSKEQGYLYLPFDHVMFVVKLPTKSLSEKTDLHGIIMPDVDVCYYATSQGDTLVLQMATNGLITRIHSYEYSDYVADFEIRIPLMSRNKIEFDLDQIRLYSDRTGRDKKEDGRLLAESFFALLSMLMANRPPMEFIYPDEDLSRQQRRKFTRDYGKKPSPYILVDLRDDQSCTKTSATRRSSKKKEHIVRGHFRYVENHPFIPDGTYYINPHTRGGKSENNDDIKRRYRVILPESDEQ